jgi:hypothetical protein
LPDTKILPTAEIPDDEQPALERVTDTPLEAQSDIAQASEPDLESAKQENADIQADVTREATVAEEQADATKQESVEQQAQQPAPEDIPARDEPDEDVPLGAESAPSVDTELHKTHPSIH